MFDACPPFPSVLEGGSNPKATFQISPCFPSHPALPSVSQLMGTPGEGLLQQEEKRVPHTDGPCASAEHLESCPYKMRSPGTLMKMGILIKHFKMKLVYVESKPLQMVIAAMKLRNTPWKESYDQLRQHIKKQRHYFANKGTSSQGYGFSSGQVWM